MNSVIPRKSDREIALSLARQVLDRPLEYRHLQEWARAVVLL